LTVHPPVERHHFALTRRSAGSDRGIGRIVDLLADNAARLLGQPPRAVATPRSTQSS
jgi:hypothetical protein